MFILSLAPVSFTLLPMILLIRPSNSSDALQDPRSLAVLCVIFVIGLANMWVAGPLIQNIRRQTKENAA
jgi:hypothetical protein